MEELESLANTVENSFSNLFSAEIYDGQSLNDLLTPEALLSLVGNVLAVALSFDEVKIMRLTEGGLKAETGSTMEDLEAMKSWGG